MKQCFHYYKIVNINYEANSRDPTLKHPEQFPYTPHQLASSTSNIEADLSDDRIPQGELGESRPGDRELAYAYQSNPKLRDRNDPAGKLPDGKNPLGNHRNPVGAVFEGDVDKGQSEDGECRFVLKAPPVPFIFGRIRRPTIGTGERLLRDLLFAFSTRFHVFPLYH